MRGECLAVVAVALFLCRASGADSPAAFTDNLGNVYSDAVVLRASPTHLFITYSDNGRTRAAGIRFEDLPEQIRRKYGYSPTIAEEHRRSVAAADAAAEQRNAAAAQAVQNAAKANQKLQDQQKTAAAGGAPARNAEQAAGRRYSDWQLLSSNHARVYYKDSDAFAAKTSSYVEEIFAGMLKRVDCIKGLDLLWSMENSVKIYVYSSQQEMTTERGIAAWAAGCANYQTRTICILNSDSALRDVVSHELGHLVFNDLMGQRRAPDWISEGVAQWLEPDDSRADNLRKVAQVRQAGGFFALRDLFGMRTARLDSRQAGIFYCQAMSLVDFLIGIHGFDIFKKFCNHIQNGNSVDTALTVFYADRFTSSEALEKAWKDSLR